MKTQTNKLLETIKNQFKGIHSARKDEVVIRFNWQNATEKLDKLNRIIANSLLISNNWTKEEIIAVDKVRKELPIVNLDRLQDISDRSVKIKNKLATLSIDELEKLLGIN
jgi:hypothetical protein